MMICTGLSWPSTANLIITQKAISVLQSLPLGNRSSIIAKQSHGPVPAAIHPIQSNRDPRRLASETGPLPSASSGRLVLDDGHLEMKLIQSIQDGFDPSSNAALDISLIAVRTDFGGRVPDHRNLLSNQEGNGRNPIRKLSTT